MTASRQDILDGLRRASLVLACAVLVGAAAPAVAAGQPVRSDQEILMDLERAWDRAFRARDVAFIEGLLADEFIATYGDGERGDKAEELARVAAFNQRVDSSRLDDFIVRIYGDTAIVWFTQYLVGPVQGEPTEVTLRYVDVWVFRDGRWQCVSSQSTRVGERAG